ncbi:MAG: pyrroloquinoline quinone biosynthesis protein PqqB [Phyllobacteriaceae bacterium]|nr:pyrroloquinoline quinone biosynthesis protein PqqB [Phyllobacteriaceae bacterium]
MNGLELRAIVLGSGAGGGVPQWNCRCRVCRLAWSGDLRVRHRTQSSLAVSVDGDRWLLLNASPDLRRQITDTPALHPRGEDRQSPIVAVLPTNADVDHVAGLLTLRERQPLVLHATRSTLDTLAANRIFDVLAADVVERRAVGLGEVFEPLPGLSIELFAVPGKVPLWLEEGDVVTDLVGEGTVGVAVEGGGRRLLYVPGCARMTPSLEARIAAAHVVLFDGTLFDDEEMIREGLGTKTGRRMGHMPMTGPGSSTEAFAAFAGVRKIFVHINNSNPALIEGSPEADRIDAAGWDVAFDGMEIVA